MELMGPAGRKSGKKGNGSVQIYFAPMEGITGYIYRTTHRRYYPGLAKYFTPFLSPGAQKGLGKKELRDILPENNVDVPLIPQIMTCRSEDFLCTADLLTDMGYQEINLNLGCPSGTVVAKKKGAGFLAYPDELDRFLEEVFDGLEKRKSTVAITVKTRIGKDSPDEFPELLAIYNRYPLKELIIHPRIQTDFYRNHPNMEIYWMALEESRNPVVYNGYLFDAEKIREHCQNFPGTCVLMLGRGLLRDPGLAGRVLRPEETGENGKQTRKAFVSELCSRYEEAFSGDRNVLFKMKEIWFYMEDLFPGAEKVKKKIKKASSLSEYRYYTEELFEYQDIFEM